jgi:hypothetical protein
MSPAPQPETCAVRKRLIDELLLAHTLLAELNDIDVQFALRGDWAESEALTNQLKQMRLRRETALEALRKHAAEHGCQG